MSAHIVVATDLFGVGTKYRMHKLKLQGEKMVCLDIQSTIVNTKGINASGDISLSI